MGRVVGLAVIPAGAEPHLPHSTRGPEKATSTGAFETMLWETATVPYGSGSQEEYTVAGRYRVWFMIDPNRGDREQFLADAFATKRSRSAPRRPVPRSTHVSGSGVVWKVTRKSSSITE